MKNKEINMPQNSMHTYCVGKIHWILLLVLSVFFLLIMSFSTSPFYDSYGGDSAIFILVGKSIAAGKTLYKDVFDHKGPVFFAIEGLLQMLSSGRGSVFIFQVLNLFVTLFLIRRISLFFVPAKQSWIIILSSLLFLGSCFEGGNFTEEYSLPLLLFPVYLFLKDIFVGAQEYKLKHSFYYGLCFALLIFIRATNAAPLCAIILTIIIILSAKKEWLRLLKHASVFLLALLLITGIICFYFLYKGTLNEMLYDTFLFNVKYGVNRAGVTADPFRIKFFIYSLMILSLGIVIPGLYFRVHKKNILLLLSIFISLFSFIVTCLVGNLYLHYQMINLVSFTLSISMLLHLFSTNGLQKKYRQIYILISCLIILLPAYFYRMNLQSCRDEYFQIKADVFPPADIPEADKDRVIAYNVPVCWYLRQNILPCYKNFHLQDFMATSNPDVWQDFNQMLLDQPPFWIITSREILNPGLPEIIDCRYEKVSASEKYIVYKIKNEYRI